MDRNADDLKDFKLILKIYEDIPHKELKNLGQRIMRKSDEIITFFINKNEKGIGMLGMLGKNPARDLDFVMGTFVENRVINFNGKGGGGKDYGQGFVENQNLNVNDVLSYIEKKISE